MNIHDIVYIEARHEYKNASSGNRTRATTLATLYSTTEPMTLHVSNVRDIYAYEKRHQQDLNLRGQSPSDFKSDALTTRPLCL